MRRAWKYLIIIIWMIVFSTISICTCQETFYIFLDYQYPYIAHFSFTIFLEKEAFRRLLIINQTIKFSFNFLVG